MKEKQEIKEIVERFDRPDVVGQSEQFNCGKDRVYGEERCKIQCDMCELEYKDN